MRKRMMRLVEVRMPRKTMSVVEIGRPTQNCADDRSLLHRYLLSKLAIDDHFSFFTR